MEVIEQIPKTALDVFRLLPEGTLCEVIENVLYMSPAPKYTHQRLVSTFHTEISVYLKQTRIAEVIISPFDVYLEQFQSAVQPDLLIIMNENRNILKDDGYVHGAPDIIIEVLSADKKRDTVKKKRLYEKAGVQEYFVVDPDTREITAWKLTENAYQELYASIGIFRSAWLSLNFEF